jgi:hypothetical protein
MDPKLFKEIEEAAYKLASLLNKAAVNACHTADTHAVHHLVSEERKASLIPHNLKRRYGIGN